MKLGYVLLPIVVAIWPTGIKADERDTVLVNQLSAILKDRLAPTWQRVEAVKTLGKLGAKAEAAVPELTFQLGKLQGEYTVPIQEAIVVTLGQIGSPAKPAIPAMTKLAGRDVFFDQHIRKSTDQILNASEDADLPMLIRLLKNKEEAQRLRAAKALGKLGMQAKSAVTELTVSLTDVDVDVRRAALNALRQIQGNVKAADALNVLILDLQDTDPGHRIRAAKTLGSYGKEAAGALQSLQNLMTDPDRDVRRAVLEALTAIGG